MVFKVILCCILTLYSSLSLFAFVTNKTIKTSVFRVAICVISCVLVFISSVGILFHNIFFSWTLVTGIVLLQAIALMNGFLIHSRPNWLHHFIRMIFSVLIIWFYITYT